MTSTVRTDYPSPVMRLVTATTDDGVTLHGALSGRPDRGGILAVHGAWGNFYSSPPASLLEAAPGFGLSVLSMNGRGHDMGGQDNGAPSIGWLRERIETAPSDLSAARDTLVEDGANKYIVVAHSYGCARTTYWLSRQPDPRCVGLVLLSPPPAAKAVWDPIEGFDAELHFEAARAAVAAGDPDRLIMMREEGPVPLMASAGTIVSVWAPGNEANCEPHVASIDIPCLVVAGGREPTAFHDAAHRTVELCPQGELLVVDDNHFYSRGREALIRSVLGWAESNQIWERTPGMCDDIGC